MSSILKFFKPVNKNSDENTTSVPIDVDKLSVDRPPTKKRKPDIDIMAKVPRRIDFVL